MAFFLALIPLIPQLIQAGVVTFDVYDKIRTMIAEDRSLSDEERAELEQKIAERQAVLNDTSRDV